jgi:hypothetical protein
MPIFHDVAKYSKEYDHLKIDVPRRRYPGNQRNGRASLPILYRHLDAISGRYRLRHQLPRIEQLLCSIMAGPWRPISVPPGHQSGRARDPYLRAVVDIIGGQRAVTIRPVSASTPMWSLRRDRRRLVPCFSTNHSPAPVPTRLCHPNVVPMETAEPRPRGRGTRVGSSR